MTSITVLRRSLGANRAILTNTSSLLGTTAVTSLLGLVFWGVAPVYFSINAIGLAGASVAAMMLLGQVSMLGLGTLLIGEFPRHRGQEASLVAVALITTTITGGALGALFAVLAPHVLSGLQPLAESAVAVVIFALGVALTASTFVLDQALIGLLRGDLQFGRNTVLAVAKLLAVMVAGIVFRGAGGLAIYGAWAFGNIASLLGLALLVVARKQWPHSYRPRWTLLRGLGRSALGHHALNLVQQVPNTAFPLVVTAVLSVAMTGYFYYSWMIASFAFLGLTSLATVLYAVGATDPVLFAKRMQLTLRLALVGGVAAAGIMLVGANAIMMILGHGNPAYVQYGAPSLRILELGVFPLIIRTHYVAVCRVSGRLGQAATIIAVGGGLELIGAGLGAHIGALTGLSVGWVIVVSVEAAFMVRVVYRAAYRSERIETGVSVS